MPHSDSKRLGTKYKKTLIRESDKRRHTALEEGWAKVLAAKGALDTTIALDGLAMMEETARHFYFNARLLEGLGEDVN